MNAIKLSIKAKLFVLFTSIFLSSTFSIAQTAENGQLILKNNESQKEKIIGEKEKITI